jgi:hypothetical protein
LLEPDLFSKSQEILARGKDAPFPIYEIVMNITNGVRGRKKTHPFRLSVPLVAASTVEDKVRDECLKARICKPPPPTTLKE